MIRIERLTLREIHLPLVEPFRTAGGEVRSRRILLLELGDADGPTAWSECVAQADPGYSPDTVDTCWLAIHEWLAPRVVGNSIAAPIDARGILANGIRGHRMARAAVEMGVWVLEAVTRGQSLARLLASASSASADVPPRTHVESGVALGMHASSEALVVRARQAAADGYRRIKLKVSPDDAVAAVSAVRAALGKNARMSVDANSSFRLDDAAHLATLEELDGFVLAMIEQPLSPGDLRRHAILQHRLRTPICLDESITGIESAEDMLALGSGRVINLKPGRVGGFAEALDIHDLCVRAGVALWCGGMLESGVGRACNVALASLPGFTEPGDLSPSARYWARDIVSPAWTMDGEGRVNVPLDVPGLGVEVDTGFIDDCTVRATEIRARRQ